MRIAVFGAGVLTSLVLAALAAALLPSVSFAQRAPTMPSIGGTGQLIALATQAGENRQQVTVIDPATRVLGVYHIDTTNGKVTLKSVRNLHFDLQMMEFNGTSPLPDEIRSMLDQK